jgi:hypothetical protein
MDYLLIQLAALLSPSDIGFDGPTSGGNIMANVLNAVYFWAGAIAVIIIVVAGFLYTTSNDNQAQLTRAKNAILAACIGLVVVALAFTITKIVLGGF